jgi:SAM-dependent methyltransferase
MTPVCPRCHEPVEGHGCDARWEVVDGILDCASEAGDPVSTEVRAFYEERPFPNYRPEDDRGTLMKRGRANGFTRALDEAIPLNARIVELGCGTGQLPMFLGLASGRRCIGVDLTQASLKVAEGFRQRSGLDNVTFVRGNLFEPPIAPGTADIAISTGVLHHTADARAGFKVLASLAKPGGLVIVGLYNTWGRLLLPLMRSKHRALADSARGDAWYHDQHHHPHETRHTVDEVLGWLDEEGLDFVSASPPITFGDTPGGFFEQQARGSRVEHWLAQLSWLGRAADGGLWVTVARKR